MLDTLDLASVDEEPPFGAGTKDRQVLLKAFGFGNQGETDSAKRYLEGVHGSGALFDEAEEAYKAINQKFGSKMLDAAINNSRARLNRRLSSVASDYGGILEGFFNTENGQLIENIRQKINPQEFEQLALLKQLSDDLVDRKTTKNQCKTIQEC